MDSHTSNTVQILVVMLGVFHALTFQQWISLGILITGVLTLLVNGYYKQKHLELARKK